MNTRPSSPMDAVSALPFALPSPEWSTTFEEDIAIEGRHTFHTDVLRAGNLVCRIVFAGQFANWAAAEEAATARLAQWMADYRSRPTAT